jgi:hypothetical protein
LEPRGGTEAAVTARVATPRAARSAAAPRISAHAAGEAHEPPKAMHVPRRESADPRKGDERKRAVFRTRARKRVGVRTLEGSRSRAADGGEEGREPAVAERCLAALGAGPRDASWPREMAKRPFRLGALLLEKNGGSSDSSPLSGSQVSPT